MAARRSILALVSMLLLTVAIAAQGIKIKRSAQVMYGSAKSCSQPASVRFAKVRAATKEWKKIRSEGVKKGSARYSILISAMNTRIKKACKAAAEADGRDCVVRKKDVLDSRGLTVKDLTQDVIDAL